MKFLGDVYEEKILDIIAKLGKIAEQNKRFQIKVAKIGVFPSVNKINVIWAGIEDFSLLSLVREVNKELDHIRKEEHENEVPHLTLARVKTSRGKEKLQEFVKMFENQEFGTMAVGKFILFESELTREGPVYTVVKEFGLRYTKL